MTKPTHLTHQTQILATLFSPTFPIGAFSYSHGIEAAIFSGSIVNSRTAQDWVKTCLIGGSGRNDAILMANAYRATNEHTEGGKIKAINELAFALSSGAERAKESRELGMNFVRIVDDIYQLNIGLFPQLAYPVAAGITTRFLRCNLRLSLIFFLQSFVNNLISVVVRTVPLGQSEGQIIIAKLMSDVAELAKEVAVASLDDIGGYSVLADHASILHETLEPRIYRT